MRDGLAFECRFEVRWSDLDGNRHVRNTAFSEYATHTRFQLLASHGFDQARLRAMQFGPVMMREEIRYKREVLFGDALVV
ncbi:MAG TPA: acyl-CoA thioesterase, partial [Longimicrobium sp.]|nr:acyl-CoA thioesterase [Longimicrobium sp.]